ncbi:MAG: aminopeptidase [Thermodesulfobacteriota bacterium]
MPDPRTVKLADILVNHSLRVKRGDTVMIAASSELAKPLVIEAYRKVLEAGGHPQTSIAFEELSLILFDKASRSQLAHFPETKLYEAEHIDCFINIRAAVNKKALSNVDPKRMAVRSTVMKPISETIVNRKRWVLCNFPTNGLAQEADMSLAEYERFLYGATNINWEKVKKEGTKLKRLLDRGRSIRVVGRETDITIGIEGRKSIPCFGERNMPDGEVFLSPLEDSAEGHIYFEPPAIYQGREVLGIRLRFKGGKVVDASAEKNEPFLIDMLDTDRGARYLGEVGIGINYGIKRFSKDILFDEKVGGTVHLAVGRSYEEAGGKNDSAIHWDIIKDLRRGGELFIDRKLVQKNGRFLI